MSYVEGKVSIATAGVSFRELNVFSRKKGGGKVGQIVTCAGDYLLRTQLLLLETNAQLFLEFSLIRDVPACQNYFLNMLQTFFIEYFFEQKVFYRMSQVKCKEMKPRIGKGILRRKCEMNMGSKTHRLASTRLRTVCFGTHRLAKVPLVRLKHPEF